MAKGTKKIEIDTELFDLIKSGRQHRIIVPGDTKKFRAGEKIALTVPQPVIEAGVSEVVGLGDIAAPGSKTIGSHVMLSLSMPPSPPRIAGAVQSEAPGVPIMRPGGGRLDVLEQE